MDIKIRNIIWDTEENGEIIPQEELNLPPEVEIEVTDSECDSMDEIIDRLSEEYGYCIMSFDCDEDF